MIRIAWTAHTKMLFIFHLISIACSFHCMKENWYISWSQLAEILFLSQSCQQCSLHCMHSSATDLLIPLNSVYVLSLCWQELFSLFQANHSKQPIIAQPINHKSLWARIVAHIQIEFVWLHLPNCLLMSKSLLIYALVVTIYIGCHWEHICAHAVDVYTYTLIGLW